MTGFAGGLSGEEVDELLELLSAVERREAGLLTWGLVDAAFTREELESLVLDFLSERRILARFSAGELVDQLVDRHLLHRFHRAGTALLRSRMAETIRLLARLRQIWRKQPWQAGRPLVADYRLVVRPRERPIRELTSDAVLERLEEAGVDLSTTRRDAVIAYMNPPGERPLELASFQAWATEEIFQRLDGRHPAACVVSAGTGSGKTHAFYLPAMSYLAELIDIAGEHWTKAIAIYPRNELLKDQLRTALQSARRLDGLQQRRGRRPITIGAWFGPTPRSSRAPANWPKARGGDSPICPFLVCPDCGADMVWKDQDRTAGNETLRCVACTTVVGPEHLLLSRQAMAENPPDLLFTTTESLNRQLASSSNGRVFGIGARQRPRLCLLDEIHTYEGVHGAQVALLLRRWRHAAGHRAVFVGLSATLENAASFMAELTGVLESQTVAIEATDKQLRRSGMEYLLALRHEPGSGTTPLSTTIQTAMLMARMIDPPHINDGVGGRRVFAFTDRLDSVNRLYWDLLDAEGWFSPGFRRRNHDPLALATMRRPGGEPTPAAADRRRGAGQSWDMAEDMGHGLGNDRQLEIGRTTSQDTGVEGGVDVVVATASLEVGYDDDQVGVVIQHKAPHDAARFIQRKGRAGRRTETRPWSIVVLTDIGRDRITYQSYDQLFSPRLTPNRLPVANRYVLRMQAVYATLDWLARRLTHRGDWAEFAGPPKGSNRDYQRKRQEEAAAELRKVLTGDAARRSLESHLGTALRLSAEDLRAVLWEPPRALMTAVLPTLWRRLDTGWEGEAADDRPMRTPLPEFMPPSLFSELLLPEVEITAPVPRQDPWRESRGVASSMGEFWIGNVTRRYGVRDRTVRHWAPPPQPAPDAGPSDRLVLDDYPHYACDPVGTFRFCDDRGVQEVSGFQLRAVHLELVPEEVKDSTRGQPTWAGNLTPAGAGRQLPIPAGTGWEDRLASVGAFLHRDGSAVEIDRFAVGAVLTSVTREGVHTRRMHMAHRQSSDIVAAAVGFRFEADGLRLSFRDPGPDELAAMMDPTWIRRSRAAYLYRRFEDDDGFPDDLGPFQRHWLRLSLTAAALRERRTGETGLADPLRRMERSGLGSHLRAALDVMFEMIPLSDDDTETAASWRGATHAALAQLCDRDDVLAGVRSRLPVLTDLPDDTWLAWEARRLRSTLAAAVLHAAAELCPDVDPDDLVVDIDPVPGDLSAPGLSVVWLTEAAPGGNGIVERIVDAWRNDPVRFLRIMRRALDASDFERLDDELGRVLALAATTTEVERSFAEVRAAWPAGHSAVSQAVAGLREALSGCGVALNRQVMVALNTRVLSPGSSPASDTATRSILAAWEQHEIEAGVELESRLLAAILADDASLDEGLRLGQAGEAVTAEARYDVLANLLWPRRGDLRLVSLMPSSLYAPFDQGERRGLDAVLGSGPASIPLEVADLTDRVGDALRHDGHVYLEGPAGGTRRLRAALLDLAVTAVDSGYLLSYPRITACDRAEGTYRLLLELPEVKA